MDLQIKKELEEKIKSTFAKKAPKKYNQEAIVALLHHTEKDHKNEKGNFFFSRLNDFDKKVNELNNNWLSLFAEIHIRYIIAEILKSSDYNVLFSRKDENDLYISKNNQKIFIEVKAIIPSRLELDTFWVNQGGLIKLIDQKLKNKPEQIKKADIICFYSFNNMFDSEDLIKTTKIVVKRNNRLNNKKWLMTSTAFMYGTINAVCRQEISM